VTVVKARLSAGSGDQRKTLNLLSFQGASLTELDLEWRVLFSYCSHAIFLVSPREAYSRIGNRYLNPFGKPKLTRHLHFSHNFRDCSKGNDLAPPACAVR
jgi:hypothetical protein